MISTLEQAIRTAVVNPEAFEMSFNSRWKELGYSRKDTAVEAMKRWLKKGEHYTQYDPVQTGTGFNPKPEKDYSITPSGFKQLLMTAETPEGLEARLYYIRIEEEYRAILTARFAAPVVDPRLATLPDLYQQLGSCHQTIAEQQQQIAALQSDRANLRAVAGASYAELPDSKVFKFTIADANAIIGFASERYLRLVVCREFIKGRDWTGKGSNILLTEAALYELAVVCRSLRGVDAESLPELLVIERSRLVGCPNDRSNTRFPKAAGQSPVPKAVEREPKVAKPVENDPTKRKYKTEAYRRNVEFFTRPRK